MKKTKLMVKIGLVGALALGVTQGWAVPVLNPGVDYSFPNYANSPLPQLVTNIVGGQPVVSVVPNTGIRKFVDGLPGLTAAGTNNLGQFIPVAVPDTISFGNTNDYYEFAAVEYTEQMHSDLPPTTLRGYVQIETPRTSTGSAHYQLRYPNGTAITDLNGNNVYAVNKPHYLGPLIVAHRDRPTRIKFTNYLPTGAAGTLFIPVDTTLMGAGTGPRVAINDFSMYTQNRIAIHLHGGDTPWISDGTPFQWFTPAGENTPYKRGASYQNVPDMWFINGVLQAPGTPGATNDPGNGSLTLYYPNQQSGRLMFYHDHAQGLTRLNVYAGCAAGYLIVDPIEDKLINGGTITYTPPGASSPISVTVPAGTVPATQIPLIIQDRNFVPDPAQLAETDPLWTHPTTWAPGRTAPGKGNFWFPHVYVPNQDPDDNSGANPLGRWDYGQWFWPIFPVVPPYYPPTNSTVPEAFADTPVVNGTAYPYLNVQPTAYRFRILNACNDRSVNLQLYQADPTNYTVTDINGKQWGTEVRMVPAVKTWPGVAWPADWLKQTPGMLPDVLDMREGGVPDPSLMGPTMVQIGTEGGLLSGPAELPNTPVGYEQNKRNIIVLNISTKTLWLGPAERADIIIDFSQFAGKTVILYNDCPAPVPAGDPRLDYYTGCLDYSINNPENYQGGAPTTIAGYGPNTRTILQFRVADLPGGPPVVTQPNYVLSKVVGTPRNDWSGYVGMGLEVGATPVTITALGRIMAPGNSDIHTLKLVDASTGIDVPGGSVLITMNPAGTVGEFQYGNLAAPVTLPAGGNYYLVSQESYAGDTWYNYNTTIATAAIAVATPAWGSGPGTWRYAPFAGQSFGPLDFKYMKTNYVTQPPAPFDTAPLYTALPAAFGASQPVPIVPQATYSEIYSPAMPYVTSVVAGTPRNDWNGFVGMKLTVGTDAITIQQLGRIMASGNSGTHLVKIVNADTGNDVPGGSVSITMNPAGPVGQFQYQTLASPVTLAAGSSYFIVSQETYAGDVWYNYNTTLATTGAGLAIPAWGNGPGTWNVSPSFVGQCFVPVNFKYSTSRMTDTFARIQSTSLTFKPIGAMTNWTVQLKPKAIQELFDPQGRMNGTLGVEMPFSTALIQTTIPYGYEDPTTEIFNDGETQFWKITHNGVDTHPVHFHLFNVQVIDRIGWDGAIYPPEPNERGWKDTVLMHPLMDTVVAMRAKVPDVPFPLPDSVRPLVPALPLGKTSADPDMTGVWMGADPMNNPIIVTNEVLNFGWEYVWHCHILGHEENNFMRAMVVIVQPNAPTGLTGSPQQTPSGVNLSWNYTMGASLPAGFRIERAPVVNNVIGTFAPVWTNPISLRTFLDTSVSSPSSYAYRVFASSNGGTDSNPSNTNAVNVPLLPPSAPTLNPINMTLSPLRANLSWSANPGAAATGYRIMRAVGNGAFSTLAPVGAGTTTYGDTAVNAGVTYRYYVIAINAAGDSLPSETRSVTTTPTAVQFISNTSGGASTLNAVLPNSVAAGNLIVVAVAGRGSQPAANNPVVDNRNNVYRRAGNVETYSGGGWSAVYYASNTQPGSTTVTLSAAASTRLSIIAAEFAGLRAWTPLETSAGATGNNAAPATTAINPGQAGNLFVGATTHATTTVTFAGSGFNMLSVATEDGSALQPLAMEYLVVPSTASTSVQFSLGTSSTWAINGAVFRHQ